MKKKIFVLGVATAISGIGYAIWSTGYFDDPAIKACRFDITSRLKSPSSYREIKTSLYSVGGGNYGSSVFIEYEAENSFGASIRDIAHCEWVYFNSNFFMKLPYADDKEKAISSLLRWSALSREGLYSIGENETKLRSIFPDQAFDACLKKTTAGVENFRLPPTYTFDVFVSEPKDYTVSVEYKSLRDEKSMPPAATCQVKSVSGQAIVIQKWVGSY